MTFASQENWKGMAVFTCPSDPSDWTFQVFGICANHQVPASQAHVGSDWKAILSLWGGPAWSWLGFSVTFLDSDTTIWSAQTLHFHWATLRQFSFILFSDGLVQHTCTNQASYYFRPGFYFHRRPRHSVCLRTHSELPPKCSWDRLRTVGLRKVKRPHLSLKTPVYHSRVADQAFSCIWCWSA